VGRHRRIKAEARAAMYPKARVDALTDGLFGVAMTILILDVRLPDDFHPGNDGDLARALLGLWPKFFPYALSFYVLGSTWLANVKLRSRGEFLDRLYASWWLLYLLLATCLPFSTSVVGRFFHYDVAIWLYTLNMAALAAVGYRLLLLLPELDDDKHTHDRKVSLLLLLGTSLLCAVLSLIVQQRALWIYLLNIAAGPMTSWLEKKRVSGRG
jgi:uncharacterized membrane protein